MIKPSRHDLIILIDVMLILTDVFQVVESCLSDVGSARLHHMESSKNDVVMTDLNATEATVARDTLCKHLYHRLFTWIVNSINDKVKVPSPSYLTRTLHQP